MSDPYFDLKLQTLKMFSELDGRSIKSSFADIDGLIGMIRLSLKDADGRLGEWESSELKAADDAFKAGFPKLALISAAKALAVSQLSERDYSFGWDLAHGDKIACDRSLEKQNANEIIEFQKNTALYLYSAQEETSRQLQNKETLQANDLRISQKATAAALKSEQENLARTLKVSQDAALEKSRPDDAQEKIASDDDVQIASWLNGGYSITTGSYQDAYEEPYIGKRDKQKFVANELKEEQAIAAIDLLVNQEDTSQTVLALQNATAINLVIQQQTKAIVLLEKQTIDLMREQNNPIE